MQYVIVGSLLMVIIAGAGWFIVFFSRLTNTTIRLEEIRLQLDRLLKKRAQLFKECELCAASNSAELVSLIDRLTATEQKLAALDRAYNETVHFYNGYIKSFPNNIVAAIMGTQDLPYLEDDAVIREPGCSHIELQMGDRV